MWSTWPDRDPLRRPSLPHGRRRLATPRTSAPARRARRSGGRRYPQVLPWSGQRTPPRRARSRAHRSRGPGAPSGRQPRPRGRPPRAGRPRPAGPTDRVPGLCRRRASRVRSAATRARRGGRPASDAAASSASAVARPPSVGSIAMGLRVRAYLDRAQDPPGASASRLSGTMSRPLLSIRKDTGNRRLKAAELSPIGH